MSNFKTVQTIVIIGSSRFRFQEAEKQLETVKVLMDIRVFATILFELQTYLLQPVSLRAC